jgi:hypothetical protein
MEGAFIVARSTTIDLSSPNALRRGCSGSLKHDVSLLRLTEESPFAFLLAAFLRLCEGGSEESELPSSLYL